MRLLRTWFLNNKIQLKQLSGYEFIRKVLAGEREFHGKWEKNICICG